MHTYSIKATQEWNDKQRAEHVELGSEGRTFIKKKLELQDVK